MKRLKISLLVCLGLAFSKLNAQVDISLREAKLCSLRKEYLQTIYQDRDAAAVLSQEFSEELWSCLNEYPNSLTHSFDSLQQLIKIVTSEDKKVRTYSWLPDPGGSARSYFTYLQYQTPEGVRVHQLNGPNQSIRRAYFDAAYLKIIPITEGSANYYLLSGAGTYGGGHHFKVLRIFQLLERQLKELPNRFAGEDYLCLITPRIFTSDFEINTNSLQISFPEFIENKETGFYESTGKSILLKWQNGQFVR